MKTVQNIEENLRKAIEKSEQSVFDLDNYFKDWELLITNNSIVPTFEKLIAALEIKYSLLNEVAYESLTAFLQQSFDLSTFNKNSRLSIIGQSKIQKNEIKKLLKKVKLKYDSIPNELTTHVLISKRISLEELKLLKQNSSKWTFLTEDLLYNSIKAILNEEKNSYLSQLLLHEDESNVELALELLKNCSNPKDYLSELFCIYIFSKKIEIQQESIIYLKKFGNAYLLERLGKIRKLINFDMDDLLIKSKIDLGIFYKYAFFTNPKDYSYFNCALLYLKEKELDYFLDEVINLWTKEAAFTISIPASVDFSKISNKIYQCIHLKELTINVQMVNPFKSLPYGISALKKLETLMIYTSLSQFPKELQQLPNLKNLTINCVSIKNLDNIFSKGFENLEYLHLYFSCFENLPKGIGSLKNLKVLDISWGNLSDLNPELGNLTNLIELNIENNKFSSIPKVLYKMQQLEKLKIKNRNNSFSLEDLEKLKTILPNCQIIH